VAIDLFAAGTVLPAPTGARVSRNIAYFEDERGPLLVDAYLPTRPGGPSPAVLLVNGDAPEPVIASAKDWGVYRSYGEHLAARGIVGLPFNHHSTDGGSRTADVAREIAAAIAYVRSHADELEVDADRIGVWGVLGGGSVRRRATAPRASGVPPRARRVLHHLGPRTVPGHRSATERGGDHGVVRDVRAR
jgi:hypothetical protein